MLRPFLILVAGLVLLPTSGWPREAARIAPLAPVSGPSPFAACTLDGVPFQFGINYPNSEVEPWIDVDPTDPMHLAAAWQQDRWSNGGSRGNVVATSFDGGLTWQSSTLPQLTRCTGGPFLRASDPWLSFAPNGDLYHISLAFTGGATNAMLVHRSTDGGLTWDNPKTIVSNLPPLFNDKEAITADPNNPRFVYAVWDRLNFANGTGPTLFARTANRGLTWGPARVIYNPGVNAQTVANQIVVQPDGTVYNFFSEIFHFPFGSIFLAFKTSENHGGSWQPLGTSVRAFRMQSMTATDPDFGRPIRDGAILFDVGVDPRHGALYAVWQDGSATGFQYPVTAFSMSTDGGMHWSAPAAVNRTPDRPDPRNRQAFLPSVAVSDNGTIGVTYYDFRFNDPGPGSLTDYWFTWCQPDAVDCSQPSRWADDVRLTDASFDILPAPNANGLFLGDYMGLSSGGGDFFALFTRPAGADRSSAFARRISIDAAIEPRSVGFWKHQVRSAVTGRDVDPDNEEPSAALLTYLDDIHALHDRFDGVVGLERLEAILSPAPDNGFLPRADQQLMVLLLNLASGRLSPFVRIPSGEPITATVASILAVLDDPGSDRHQLNAARSLATSINTADIPLN